MGAVALAMPPGSLYLGEAAQTPYDIAAAVLVEASGSKASQLSATQAVLASVAPGVALQYVLAD